MFGLRSVEAERQKRFGSAPEVPWLEYGLGDVCPTRPGGG